jgi:hypothetical protein
MSPREQAASFARLAKHHGGEAGRYALKASILLNEGKRDLAETTLLRAKTEHALAEHYLAEAERIAACLFEV